MKKNQDEPVTAADPSMNSGQERRRRAEEDELERRVQERTAELVKANEALRTEIIGLERAQGRIQDLSKFPSENPNPVLRIARDGTLLYINEAGLRLLPQWHLEVGHASPPILREAVFQSMDSGSTQELDLEHGERVYSFFVAPLVAARYANLYGRDITERKQAKEALREANQRLDAHMANSPIAVVEFDPTFRVVRWSDQAEQVFGWRRDEILGKAIAEMRWLVEEDAESVQRVSEDMLTGRRPRNLNVNRNYRKDGAIIQCEWYNSAIYNEQGRVISILSHVLDITERKRTEEALGNREGVLQRIFDILPVGLWFADKDGKLQRGNPAGVKIWGAEPRVALSELGVFKARRLPSGEEVAADDWALAHTIRDRVTIVDELLEIDAFDGRKKTILNYTAPVLDARGEVQGAIVVNQDITERMRAEERMRTFSREIIVAREEERKQVSSALHHDVGSLAVGVSAHLDAIEGDLRSGKPGEALKWTRRTRKLFDESVARLKEVAVQLRPPELDALGLCAALRQHFSRVTKHVGTRIHFRETLGRRRVSGDAATTLFRVAQETLTNAITHGDAKQVDVFLSASKKEVKLTIRDDGKGFIPSGQKGQATSRMGLRVMKEMAASSGGGFEIHSRRGKGTTVRVSLPYKTAERGGA